MNPTTESNNVVYLNSLAVRADVIDPSTTLVRMKDVMALTGLARGTVYKKINKDPTFPQPVKLGEGSGRGAPVGFVLGEVQDWVRSKIANRDRETEQR